jgi:hypothetical protein
VSGEGFAAPGTLAGRIPSLEAGVERAGRRLAGAIAHAAPPGSATGTWLDRGLRLPWHAIIAYLVFSIALGKSIDAEMARGYPMAILAALAVPAGLFLLRRPLALALVFVAAGVYLRALYVGYPEGCDQLAVSRAALGVALGGGNPYGIGYAQSWPPGAPFPYGPGAMVAAAGGVPLEIAAVAGIMLVLAFCRSLLTLAVLAAWVPAIEFGICGQNDQVPAFLLLAGLLLIERRRMVAGAGLVALSAAIKPYTFAWFAPLIGFGGISMAAVLITVSAVAWLPMLLWGPGAFLRSVEMARDIHPVPENTLNHPELRVLAVPVALLSLLARSWSMAVLLGALIFVIVLFLDRWASVGYWFVVIPPLGVIGERALAGFGAALRSARRTAFVPAGGLSG